MEKSIILYNEKDKEIAVNLEESLNNNGLVWINTQQLAPEITLESQITEALPNCDFILCVLSNNLIKSKQKTNPDLNINERSKIIPVYVDKQSRDTDLLSQYDKKIYLDETGKDNIKKLITLLTQKDELETYAKIQSSFEDNPFSKVRAEFFDYAHLANTFFEPEREKYDLIVSPKAVILEGGRGSGKTMVLRSLAALAAIERTKKATFKDSGLQFFGVYMRLDRGGFALASVSEFHSIKPQIAKQLFLDDFNLQFTQSLLETIHECVKREKLVLSLTDENIVCKEILRILKPDHDTKIQTISNFLNYINEEKRNIRKYVGQIILHDEIEYEGCITSQETFKEICKIILEHVIKFNNVTVFLLLDEYENLMPNQQIIINSLIKLSDKIVSLKIASKFEGIYTRKTLFGEQDLQIPHDYSSINMDYNIRDDRLRTQYENLVKGITEKLLIESNFKQTDIKKLLKPSPELKLTEDDLKEQLGIMLQEKNKDISTLSPKEVNQKIAYYKDALIFRALQKNQFRKGKTYAGFDTFILLSSGIIRQFLELCAMSLYISQEEGYRISDLEFIEPKFQTRAVHKVSAASLEKIAPGVEDLGIIIQRFIIDLGDIFRDRLLHDNNEPETIRIMVNDPRVSWPNNLKQVYQIGIRESVFQNIEEHDSMRPKQQNYARPIEFIINRIFTPVLEISPRARWRTSFNSTNLSDLLKGEKRADVIKRIIPKRKTKSPKNFGVKSLDQFNESGEE